MASRTTAGAVLLRRLSTAFLPLAVGVALVATSLAPVRTTGGGDRSAVAPALRLAAQAPASSTYTTFTLNIKHDLGRGKALQDMRRALTLGDAGGFQEMSDLVDRQSLAELCKARDWGFYMPRDGGVAIPIVWNRARFRMIDAHTVKVHGAEAGVTPARFINVVRLREVATGKVFGFINTHTIAQASRDAQATDMHRIPRLRRHLRMLRHEIIALFGSTEHVFASGDLNVNYLADRRRRVAGLPTRALGDLVSFDMPLTGSRGPTSLLDYGMTVKDSSGIQPSSSRIVRGFNSDHDAVVLTYHPVDLFAVGPLFNRPDGGVADRNRVRNRQARAIMDAEPGALVRLVASRIDDPTLVAALQQAHAEGVQVRVVLGGGAATASEAALAATLGSDTAAPSWLVRCAGTCLGGSGTAQTNFLLVSRAGGTSELTMVGSGPFVQQAADRWGDTLRVSTAPVYDGYGRLFDRYAADTTDTTRTRVLSFGSYRAQLYPVPAVTRRDPVLRALAPIGCRNARGLHTPDGRTNVRVSVGTWSGDRGRLIAQRLAELQGHGCDVVAVLGPRVLSGIRKTLTRAHIPTRDAATAENLLIVDGRYGKRAGGHYAWTGGPSWTTGALTSDGVTLVVPDAGSVKAYLGGFSRAWRNG